MSWGAIDQSGSIWRNKETGMVWVKADGFHPLLHLDQIHSRCANDHKSTGQGPGETRLDLDSISYDQGRIR